MMRLSLAVFIVALLASGCVAKYVCPSGLALRQVDAELALDPVSVRTVATLTVCGLPVVVETRTDAETATVCVDAPLVGVRPACTMGVRVRPGRRDRLAQCADAVAASANCT